MRILAEKMPEKRSDLVQEEETVRNFRITKGRKLTGICGISGENSEDIREWKGKEETEEQEKLEIQDRIRKAVSGDWLKAVFPAGIPGYSHRRNLVFIWSRNSGTVWIYEVSVGRYTGSYPYPEPFYS